MNRRHLPFYVLTVAVLIVGTVIFGVPVSGLFVLGIVLACPLMMFFMMRGMQGGGGPDQRMSINTR